MVSLTPRLLHPRENSLWFLLNRSLVGSQSRSGHDGEDEISSLYGIRTPGLLRGDQICTIYDSQEWHVNINTVIRFQIP